ncbi:MAG: substrate-binding domain-containing protein [Tildeniella nuda ZEHNDER 1965/U140]|jgi:ABC-type phosphate transport system substrate-binding protein|nr:substrate-binding domain-containing protein [Tildeniella nuda ZEHNDER 1965/U140]
MAKIALLIGISDYCELPRLPATTRDIEELEQVLRKTEIGGFDDVRLLRDPNAHDMKVAIAELFANRKREDLILLFFSGHGVKDDRDGKLYFATADTRKAHATWTAVSAQEILDFMRNSPSKRQVVILDCCYSGAAVTGVVEKAINIEKAVDVDSNIKGLAILPNVNVNSHIDDLGGEGRVVLTSSTSTQVSLVDSELSVYTKFLIEGLETGSADEGDNGFITAHELHKYIKQKLTTAGSRMTPEFYPSHEGFEIVLARSHRSQSGNPELEYRRDVEKYIIGARNSSEKISNYLANNKITGSTPRKNLDAFRDKLKPLGLTVQRADEIESEVLEPLKILEEKRRKYREAYIDDLQNDQYSLHDENRRELDKYRRRLDLQKTDQDLIERQVHLETYEERCRELGNQRANQLPDELSVLRAKLQPHLTDDVVDSLHKKYFPNVGSSPKRITPWVFVALALVVLGVALSQRTRDAQNPTPSPIPNSPSSPDNSNQLDRISDVPDVPDLPNVEFKYGGSTTWAPLRRPKEEGGKILPAIQDAFPNFRLKYEKPPEGQKDGSRTGISMLTKKQLDIALSSDETPASEKQASNLFEVKVGKDAIAIIVNPDSGITELTIEQLQQIYRGGITNWKELGGKDLPIQPYSRSSESSTTGFVGENVFNGTPASNLKRPDTPTKGINFVKNDPGGIFFLSAPEVFSQDSVKDGSVVVLALKKDASSLSIALDSNKNFALDQSIFQDGKYPLVRGLYVVYRNDKTEAEKAGKAYAAMLCTKQAQQLLKDLGYGRGDCK